MPSPVAKGDPSEGSPKLMVVEATGGLEAPLFATLAVAVPVAIVNAKVLAMRRAEMTR